MKLIRRLLAWVRRGKHEADMAEEMRAHLEMQAERNRAAGMGADEACYAALRQFGNVASLQERVREQRSGRLGLWLEQAGQDVRYAGRQLRLSPGFTAVAVLTLALGIGANTAVFSVVDALLFRPLPVKDAAQVWSAGFFMRDSQVMVSGLSQPLLSRFREGLRSFTEIYGEAKIMFSTRVEGKRQFLHGQLVTGNYFAGLGLRPALGRGLTPADDAAPGCSPVAVISYEHWQSRYGGSPAVLGQILRVNQCNLTIVGVGPAGFAGLNTAVNGHAAFWAPAAMEKQIGEPAAYQITGRLAAGVSREQAMAELDAVATNIRVSLGGKPPVGYEQYGLIPEGSRPYLMAAALGRWGMQLGGRERAERLAALFLGAVGLVWLISCANVANLMLARALRRQREMTVRLVLGATFARLIRQLLLESLLLSGCGAVAGVVLARWSVAALLAMRAGMLQYIPLEQLTVDGRVLGFTLALAGLTAVVFGLVPAWQVTRTDLNPGLKSLPGSAAAWRRGKFTVRNLLVVGQVAACLVLLVGAGLCARSFARLTEVDAGFDGRNLLLAKISLDEEKYSAADIGLFIDHLSERVAGMPGVAGHAFADDSVAFSGTFAKYWLGSLEGYQPRQGEYIIYEGSAVGPGFFRLLGVPLRKGREFDPHDGTAGGARVVMVNESFVRRYWPNTDPLGKRIQGAEVIGVVRDVRWSDLAAEPEPRVFSPQKRGTALRTVGGQVISLWLRTERDAPAVAQQVRAAVRALDATTAEVVEVESIERLRAVSLTGQRGLLQVLGVLGGCALVMATIGLYGVLAYAVGQRTREFGVRIAVGARPWDVQWMTIRQGMALVGIGLGVGLVLATAAARGLQNWLYGVDPLDGATYAGVMFGLSLVALLACWLPARRAARVDPVVALRSE